MVAFLLPSLPSLLQIYTTINRQRNFEHRLTFDKGLIILKSLAYGFFGPSCTTFDLLPCSTDCLSQSRRVVPIDIPVGLFMSVIVWTLEYIRVTGARVFCAQINYINGDYVCGVVSWLPSDAAGLCSDHRGRRQDTRLPRHCRHSFLRQVPGGMSRRSAQEAVPLRPAGNCHITRGAYQGHPKTFILRELGSRYMVW